jgi:hypothetical protein
MNANVLGVIGLGFGLIIFLGVMGYVSYLSWLHPEKFKNQEVKRVKDWWPFANYFRRYYASNEYLWAARIGPAIFLFIFLFLGIMGILGYLGLIP